MRTIRTISGADLLMESAQIVNVEKHQKYVARSTKIAIKKIDSFFGSYPSSDGSNIEGIVAIRDELFRVSACVEQTYGYSIIAPHTHWDMKPIIVSNDHGKYEIGPREIDVAGKYKPISFVLTSDGPFAFEWCDESVYVDDENLENVYKAIECVCSTLGPKNWPLGLSIAYGIEYLFKSEPVSTNENAVVDGRITNISEVTSSQADHSHAVQAGWHPVSDYWHGLDLEATSILQEVREELRYLSADERENLIADILSIEEK